MFTGADLALIAEATRRSEAVWVGAPGSTPRLLWHLWHDGALWCVGGGGEQTLPVLEDSAVVTVRSRARPTDHVVTWAAEVSVVAPGSPEWEAVVPQLVVARLNAPDSAGLAQRWATSATVLRLIPRA